MFALLFAGKKVDEALSKGENKMFYTSLEQLKKDLGIEQKDVQDMTIEELHQYYTYLYDTLTDKYAAIQEVERFNFFIYDQEEHGTRTSKSYIEWFKNDRNDIYDHLTDEEMKRMEKQVDACQNEIYQRAKTIALCIDISDHLLIHNDYFGNGEFWASKSWTYNDIVRLWNQFKHGFGFDQFDLVRDLFIDECIQIIKFAIQKTNQN